MMPERFMPWLGFLKVLNFKPRLEVTLSYNQRNVEIRFFKYRGALDEYWLLSIPVEQFKPERKP